MNIVETAEINFHQQHEASIYLESNSTGNIQKAGEVGLLTMFALRMMFSLDVGEFSDALARLLTGARAIIPAFAVGEGGKEVQIVPYPGHAGRKRFNLKFDLSGARLKFDLDYKGFGWFSTGMGHYGPVTVTSLLRYLAQKRGNDSEYLERLSLASVRCGELHLQRQISMTNQSQLGFAILNDSCGDYLNPQSESVRTFDQLWFQILQMIAKVQGDAHSPRTAIARLISFAGSVHFVLRQFCFDGSVQVSPFAEMRERVSIWSVQDALKFAGTLQLFTFCGQARTQPPEKLDAVLMIYGSAFGMSQKEIEDWQDFTLSSLADANSFPMKLTDRLASILNPLIGIQAQAAPDASAGLAWLKLVELVQREFNRRSKDSEWLAQVDSIIGAS